MNKGWQRSFGIASCYIGAVIGAGFASGQEILQFFIQFGRPGLWGIIFAAILFSILGSFILAYNFKCKINSYDQFLNHSLGLFWGKFADVLLSFVLFAGLVVMLACSTAALKQQFAMPLLPSLLITYMVILVTVAAGEKGVIVFNSIVIPVLILITVLVSLGSIQSSNSAQQFIAHKLTLAGGNWLLASILYVSYNIILGAVMLTSLSISSQKDIWGGFLGGIGLGIIAFLIGLALFHNFNEVENIEIPMLYLAQKTSPILNYFYAAVLWLEIITTAVANIFALVQRMIQKFRGSTLGWTLFFLLAASILTPYGFVHLITAIYPVLGYLGLFISSAVVFALLKKKVRI
ncbi:hypothetical protein RDV78_04915 [Bacillota bacterium LX-D]|nr:hypothetical protein [Bacillota bacterium LX-D]